MQPHRHVSIAYAPALDGLRGIAIVCVLLFHAETSWLTGGYLGVSTFFTLSGFLITSLLLVESDRTGGIALREFWARRLRRLMPAAVLGIALATSFALVAGTPSQLGRLRWDGLSSLFYFANFRFMTSGHSYWEMFSRPSPLQHYWSLSIEEQFYVVYPLLLLGVSRLAGQGRGALRAALLFLALASSGAMLGLSLAGVPTARLYYGTDTRAAEFLIGAVLATLLVHRGEVRPWRGRAHRLVTLACVAFVVGAIATVEDDSVFLYRGGFALYALATAGILNAALAPGILRAVLALRPLRWLGIISYGTYVYHWPVYLYLDAQRTGVEGMALLLLQIAVTLVVAALSYHLVERPMRATGRLLGAPAVAMVPVAAMAVLGLLVLGTSREEQPWRTWSKGAMPELGPPAPLGPVRVLVFGDSVAFNIGNGLFKWTADHPNRATVWNLAEYGCGLVRDPADFRAQETLGNACVAWPQYWEEKIEQFRPDVVVVMTGVWDLRTRRIAGSMDERSPGDPEFDALLLDQYRLAVDIASSRGASVVWLTTPCLGPGAQESPLGAAGAVDPARTAHLNRVLLPALVASRPRQVRLFDLFAAVCPGGRYVRSLDGVRLARADAIHLTPQASLQIAKQILATIPGLGVASQKAALRRDVAMQQ